MPAPAQYPPPLIGNEATISKKSERFEIVEPTRQAKDLVSYRKIGPGIMDPVKNAEDQLRFLEDKFGEWLRADYAKLHVAWGELRRDPADSAKFLSFHKAMHTISGNAAILKCAGASSLAAPLARMLERGPKVESHIELIDSAVSAIGTAIRDPKSADDPRLHEMIAGLKTIVERWIARKREP